MRRTRSIPRFVAAMFLGMILTSTSLVAAQEASPASTGLSVTGHGEASAPAETATLQLIIGNPNYGGPVFAQVGEVPGEREREAVAPIVAALVEAGVAEDDIAVIVGPALSDIGTYLGPAIALIVVGVDSPDLEQMRGLVDAANVAASNERLLIGRTNAVYAVEDCAPLEREAREMAVADARQQAGVMAELVGVSPGDVIGVRDLPAEPSQAGFNPYGPVLPASLYACGSGALLTNPSATYALPAFNPEMEPEVTVSATVELTFAITGSAGATPAP